MKSALGALFIGVAVVVTAALFTYAFKTRAHTNDRISVAGLGTRDFEADLIVWSGSFTRKNADLKAAYNQLNSDRERVREFLVRKGATEKDLIFSAITIAKEFTSTTNKDGSKTEVFSGYRLTQEVDVESPEVDKYERLSREATDLINLGIELSSSTPQYFYSKLPNLKLEMVAEATHDAHARAERIAQNAGGHLGKLRSATLGIFQITGRNSSEEFTWRGQYNTAARRKTASVTMRLDYEAN